MTSVAVLGCGHGGQALAAQLTLKGCDVALYAHPSHAKALEQIQLTQHIELYGAMVGKARINLLTTDIQEAVRDKEIIYLVLPTSAHESTFTEMLPYLQAGQIIVTLASNFSSLAYAAIQQRLGVETLLTFVDTASLPYACRADQPGLVNIFAIKHTMSMAALPADQTDAIMLKLLEHFPTGLSKNQNVLELGLNITSGISHPLLTVLNAGRIGEGKDKFYFYKEGITPELAKLLEAIDHDRCEIGRRFGYTMTSYLDLMADYYGRRYASIYDFFTQTPVHNAAQLCPDSLNARYITQDIPYLLVPWYCLGALVDYHSDALQAVILLASQLMQQDYLKQGRNLAGMGLQNKTLAQSQAYAQQGAILDSFLDVYPKTAA